VGAVDRRGQALRMRLDVQARAEPEPRARYLLLDRFYARPAPRPAR
jgi:hypothetical protein